LLSVEETNMTDYHQYQHLLFERKAHGILFITMNRPEMLNAADARLHWELSRVWLDIADDPETRVVVITGAGRAFSAGGDLDMIDTFQGNIDVIARVMKEASDIVYNIANLDKPVVSAINGVAVGAGLAVALMADISIMAEDARITDGHIRLGVGAGDHAAIIWPLLCGMAKAKYYLLTADFLDGKEAERIGLVSLCVPRDEVVPKAMEVATKLATGPQLAVRWTKRALNHWIRQAGPIFDHSLALEMLGFFTKDMQEGLQAIKEKRTPVFPSTKA
jgi:enoyl-CoA hydratase